MTANLPMSSVGGCSTASWLRARDIGVHSWAGEDEKSEKIREMGRMIEQQKQEMQPYILKVRMGARECAQSQRVDELEGALLEAEETRRRLHNQVQELRGNVRVFCRVRPADASTLGKGRRVRGDTRGLHVTCPSSAGEQPRVPERWFGAHVACPRRLRAEVFEEVSQLVQSALDGYKVCLFSYGQTGALFPVRIFSMYATALDIAAFALFVLSGSGKTHTMQGAPMGEERGIIPRTVEKVLEAAERLGAKGWDFAMESSYVEIYNEKIRDLLSPGKPQCERGALNGDVS
eukprot:scaffold6362_cov378-Prasinococcus_capsulatus_cf.AAC.12